MSNGTTSTSEGTGSTGGTGPGPGGDVQSPLTLLIPMRDDAIYDLRKNLQKLQDQLAHGLDEIGIVHFVRLLIIPNTNILAIITTYDGSFDDYILAFVRNPIVAGTFDTFLKVTDDYLTPPWLPTGPQMVPVQKNADIFVKYLNFYDYTNVERRDSFAWYSAYPTMTVKQIIACSKPPQGGS